jgi:hypothetical protein
MKGYRVVSKALEPPMSLLEGRPFVVEDFRWYNNWLMQRIRCVVRAKQARARFWAERRVLYGYGKCAKMQSMRG